MEFVNREVIYEEALVAFLDRCFEYQGRANKKQPYEFALIQNQEGKWTIGFHHVPEMLLVLNIRTFFETEQAGDSLTSLIFNYGTPQAVEFENVAGWLAENDTAFIAAFDYARQNG